MHKTVEVAPYLLKVDAGVRYWEDARVNGTEDEDGTLIPLKVGDRWKPEILIETGVIQNWPQGTTADIHYKVCDDGEYSVFDKDGNLIAGFEGYVPVCLSPNDRGFGDYIIMYVDETGRIDGWKFTQDHFSEFE